jgi:hypothetical protein
MPRTFESNILLKSVHPIEQSAIKNRVIQVDSPVVPQGRSSVVEQRPFKPLVEGSNPSAPIPATIYR